MRERPAYPKVLTCPKCNAEPRQLCFNEISGKFDLIQNHYERVMAYFDETEACAEEARVYFATQYKELKAQEVEEEAKTVEDYEWVL